MFNYWSIPKPIQKFISWCIPTKDTWTIECTKTVYGDWVFDIFPFVKDESLWGGTEFIIDTYYIHCKGESPSIGDKITIDVSTKKMEGYHGKCIDFTPSISGFGHDYIEWHTQMTGWFCPMFEVMFGDEIPDSIYFKFS